jgi:hypothetical protein
MKPAKYRAHLVLLAACFTLAPSLVPAAPAIQITNFPAYGSFGSLKGVVSNAVPALQRVAIFIYVGGGWYSKPSCAQPLTTIQPDGSWTADITPVATDVNATIIAALLVSSNYNQPCVLGAAGLPSAVSQAALASAYVSRFNPAARQFNFCDYDWWVKSSASPAGPGPNYFSDNTNNVWVDAAGRLHLRITHRNSQWQCAEVISARSFGYGQYRFTVSADVNRLDPGVVLGLFTWSNDTAFNDREIDVELSRWNNPLDSNDAQFVVQPAGAGQLQRYSVPSDATNSTYSFIWQPGRVDFQALRGDFSAAPFPTNILRTWTCQLGVPPAGGENLRFNFWLNQGNPPTNGQEVEVILSRFEFVPLGSPLPAQIRSLNWLDHGTQINLLGQTDRRYEICTSSNLFDWVQVARILATNDLFQFVDSEPRAADLRLYRTITDP